MLASQPIFFAGKMLLSAISDPLRRPVSLFRWICVSGFWQRLVMG